MKQHRQAGRERKSKLFYEEVRELSIVIMIKEKLQMVMMMKDNHIKFSLAEQALSESLQMNCLCKTKWKIRWKGEAEVCDVSCRLWYSSVFTQNSFVMA